MLTRILAASLLLSSLAFPLSPIHYRVQTVAGAGNQVGDAGPAVQALLRSPGGVAVDSAGRLYVADTGQHRIRRIDPDGTITTIAGTGDRGVDGDDGLATQATLWDPRAVAIRSDGAVLIADGSARIRQIDRQGRISTIAGNGQEGWSGDGEFAGKASIGIPAGIVLDSAGNLYFSDVLRSVVRKVATDGRISTVAGTGTQGFSGDNGAAVKAQLFAPLGLAINAAGNLLIADYGNLRVREILSDGSIRTVAGGGQGGDGESAKNAFLAYPCAIQSHPTGVLYVSESGARIRKISADGVITTLASAEAPSASSSHIQLSAEAAPCGLAFDSSGNLIVSERGTHRITRIHVASTPLAASRIAGRTGDASESGRPLQAQLFLPQGGAISRAGDFVFVDSEAHRVYRLDMAGKLSVVAGSGIPGNSGDGGPAAAAALTAPSSVAMDSLGNVWIADSLNQRIRKVSTSQVITTVASADAPEIRNRIAAPLEIAIDPLGNVYFTELNKHTVRRMDPAGNVTPVAGGDEAGFSGDGGPALQAKLHAPRGLAVDDKGNLYIADTLNQAIRQVKGDGTIQTVAGRGQLTADGGLASRAALSNPVRVSVDGTGSLLISEALSSPVSGRIRRVDPSGIISTIAGNGATGFAGDGGLAVKATFGSVVGLTQDSAGSIFVADAGNRVIRKLSPLKAARLSVAGGDKQVGHLQSELPEPLAVAAVDETGTPVPGVDIQFRVVKGSALLPVQTAQTDRDGVALARLQLREEAGPVLVSASAEGLGSLTFEEEAVAAAAAEAPSLRDYTLQTIAGSATEAAKQGVHFTQPVGLALDAAGHLYVADSGRNAVRKISPNGQCATLAGTAEADFCQASQAEEKEALHSPSGVAVDAEGSVYFADRLTHRILKVDRDGHQQTIAGTGQPGFSGDDGPAVEAQLLLPSAVLIDKSGSVVFSDTGNRRVRKISVEGVITTVAGTGEVGSGGDGDFAVRVPIVSPAGLAIGPDGVLFIADAGTHQVKAVSREGILKVVAGIGRAPNADEQRQSDLPYALDTPAGLTADEDGTLYIGEKGRIRRLSPDGTVTAVASREWGGSLWPALHAGLLYVLDTEQGTVRRVEKDGTVTALAGSRFTGDGGSADTAALSWADGLVMDVNGNIYFSDRQNHRVRRIDATGTIETVAGTGRSVSSGDGGPARSAGLDSPAGLAIHPDGSLYVAEYRGAKIRRITPDGVINTVAGTGVFGESGDGGPARAATFLAPLGLAIDSAGSVFVADYLSNRVRKITAEGVISTVVGVNSQDLSSPTGIRGTETGVSGPSALAMDSANNLYIADKLNNRVLKLYPSGAITRVVGTGQRRAGGDGGAAVDTPLNRPSGIAVDPAGNLYVSDESQRIRKVSSTGIIVTVAGRGPAGYSGDGGPGLEATLSDPGALAVDGKGSVIFSDRGNHRIRRLTPAPNR